MRLMQPVGFVKNILENIFDLIWKRKKFYDREIFPGTSDEDIRVYAGNLYHKLLFGNLIHPPTIIFRSEVLKKVLSLKADSPTS